jgi:hypothetical protein
VLKFYIPTPVGGVQADNTPAVPSAAGTPLFDLQVAAGATSFNGPHPAGVLFRDGLYVALSGGTLLGVFFVS